jgi:hypothetical protein
VDVSDSTQSAQDLGRRRRYDSCDGVVELLKNKRFSVFHFELKSCTDTENIPPPIVELFKNFYLNYNYYRIQG